MVFTIYWYLDKVNKWSTIESEMTHTNYTNHR